MKIRRKSYRILFIAILVLAIVSLAIPLTSFAQTTEYKQAPMLDAAVASGDLPPVSERLPEKPMVIPPYSETGQYGGYLHLYAPSVDDFNDMHWGRVQNWIYQKQDVYFDNGDTGAVEDGYVLNRLESFTANADNTEFIVTLRKGMKWSDGVPVTADDILFAANDVWLNDEINPWWASWLQGNHPTSVTKVDDYTVKFDFAQPAPDFYNNQIYWGSNQGLGVGETPFHYLKQFHIKYNPDADTEAKAAGFSGWVDRFLKESNVDSAQTDVNLPTLNPWMLKSKSTTQAVYVRNPYFWAVDTEGNQLPYLDGFVVEAVSDVEVAKLKLIAGDFDAAGVFLIQLDEYPLLKQGETTGNYSIILNKGNATAKPAFCPNINDKDPVLREIFSNPDFRKALSYAINRDEISQVAFAGLAKPMQMVYTTFDNVDPSKWANAYTEFNPDKARALLDGMGLKKDADGFYLRPDGQPLTINLQTITEEGWGNTTELVATDWTNIGIKTQYNPIDRSLWTERQNANEVDMYIWHDYSYSERIFGGTWGQWDISYVASEWSNWFKTDGKSGEEPPADWKAYHDNVLALFAAPYGSDEYKALLEKVWDFRITDQLYCIGTVGDYPTPLLVKNGLGNVGNNDVPFNYWQGQFPEQWYWKDDARRAETLP